ncbi:MAG: ComEC/Rec2 family competence protein [Oscillospiraceae bacterium]
MKRPLLLIGIVFSLSLLAATYIRTNILFIASVALIAMEVCFIKKRSKTAKIIMVVIFTVALSFIATGIFNIKIAEPFLKLSGRRTEIEGIVTDVYEKYNTTYLRCKVKMPTVGGICKNPTIIIRSYQAEEGKLGETFKAKIKIDVPRDYRDLKNNYCSGVVLTGILEGKMIETEEKIFPIEKIVLKIKIYVLDNLSKRVIGDEFVLASAMITGDRDKLDRELVGYLSRSGVMHMVAVSGMHMAIVANLIKLVFSALRMNKRLSSLLTIPFIWLFGAVCGYSPSVLRSAIMLSITLLAVAIFERADILNSLGIAAIITLWGNPYIINNIGFQMSYLAVIGIAFLNPQIESVLKTKKPIKHINIFYAFTHSLSAWLFVIPTSALCFGYLSLLSPFTNVALSGIVPFTIGFGLIAGIIPQIKCLEWIGLACGFICKIGIASIIFITKIFSKMPFAIITLDRTWKYILIVGVAVIFALAFMKNKSKLLWKSATLSCVFMLLLGHLTTLILNHNCVELIVSDEITAIKYQNQAIIMELNEPVYFSYYLDNPLYNIDNIQLLIMDKEDKFKSSALFQIGEHHSINIIVAPESAYVQNYLNTMNFKEHQKLSPFNMNYGDNIKAEYLPCGCAKISINDTLLLKKCEDCVIMETVDDYDIIINDENKIEVFNKGKKNFTIINKKHWNTINFFRSKI